MNLKVLCTCAVAALCVMATPAMSAGLILSNFLFEDSRMSVDEEVDGSLIITFLKPGPLALERGIKEGDVLFSGTLYVDGYMNGHGYAFKKGCPPALYAFDMKGVLYGQDGATLYGAPPVFAKDSCEVVDYNDRSKYTTLYIVPG